MNVPDNDPAVGSERQGASLRRLALREAQGFFIGSGAMESAGNPITAARIKGPGMRWKVTDLNTLLVLRCVFLARCWQMSWHSCARFTA